jgi:hypothetical protein
MSGARHRHKGNRLQRELVAYLRDRGFAAERIPLSAGGSFISDITIPLLGADLLIGIEVHLPRHCRCGHDLLRIGPGRGAHRASLRCARCGRHCGWLSSESANFLTAVVARFGRPSAPVCVRVPRRML